MPMPADGLIDTAAQAGNACDRRVDGVTIAKVINNVDATGEGRVQVQLPWLPGVRPWARLSRLDGGTYFVPQVGAEVLVGFNHGDIREPYVLGSLWNSKDRPPAEAPQDPATKRIIRTPLGHEVEFDDLSQSITIKSMRHHTITIEPDKVEIATMDATGSKPTTRFTLNAAGSISIAADRAIEIKAPSITIQGKVVEIKSDASMDINGGQACNIQASLVKIN
ncbi:MAG: phage baseplate assembly protein V [Gammaproteobacteria bacterium]